MRIRLIVADLAAAFALLAAVVVVAPGESSEAYALITIVTSVLPGLLLTGDVKLLNAGVTTGVSGLRFKALASAALNVPLGIAVVTMQDSHLPPSALAAFVALGALGATAQAFSSVWYYTQPDKSRMLFSKAAAAATKLAFASAAIASSQFTYALVGITLGATLEFALNFRTLPWRSGAGSASRRQIISPLGAAYGLSRAVSAAVRVGLGQLFGTLIASFLVIEQLVGGMNSIFEKYFLRSTRWRRGLRALKFSYLGAMVFATPLLANTDLQPGDPSALLWLTLVACAGLLPLSEMYAVLQQRGQRFAATGSALVSLACGAFLAVAWFQGTMKTSALVAYLLLPGATFIFYWLSTINVHHNTEH